MPDFNVVFGTEPLRIEFPYPFQVVTDGMTIGAGLLDFPGTFTVNVSGQEIAMHTRHVFTPARIGLHGNPPVERPTITGSRGDTGPLWQLLDHLAARGDIVDESTV